MRLPGVRLSILTIKPLRDLAQPATNVRRPTCCCISSRHSCHVYHAAI